MKLFYERKIFVSTFALLIVTFFNAAFAQLRFDALILKPKEIYKITESDILVVDSLVMGDSSTIMLDMTKKESFLHFKAIQTGNGCSIVGRGKDGLKGQDGVKGKNGNGPCADAFNGSNGSKGSAGMPGSNLSVYLSRINLLGSLTIDVAGGDGGEGGKGGNGGDGTGGTKLCRAGDAGNGGNGGDGAKGGDGGTIKLVCKDCATNLVSLENSKLFVKVFPGNAGDGGQEGSAGNPGMGANEGKIGKDGIPGRVGATGVKGSCRFLVK